MGNGHGMIVDHDCQMIRRETVRFQDHLIVEHFVGDRHLSGDPVGKGQFSADGDLHTDNMWLPFRHACIGFFLWQIATMPMVGRRKLHRLLLFSHLVQSLGRTKAEIRLSRLDELLGMRSIEVQSLRLNIRSVRSIFARTFVEIDPGPLKSLDQVLDGTFDLSGLIGVFDAKYKSAAVMFGKEVIVERGSQSTDMEKSGRAWCESNANRRRHRSYSLLLEMARNSLRRIQEKRLFVAFPGRHPQKREPRKAVSQRDNPGPSVRPTVGGTRSRPGLRPGRTTRP